MRNLIFSAFRRRKALLFAPLFLVLTSYAIQEVTANSTGTTGYSKTGCGGNGCHGVSSGPTFVTIWPYDTEFEAGKTYSFLIKVKNSNSTGYGAGCDISADNGATLAAWSGSELQQSFGELSQMAPHRISMDSVMWEFNYTAPVTPGPAHIYAAGIVADLNGGADAGDVWGTTTYTINIVAAHHLTIDTPQVFRAIADDTLSQWITIRNPGSSARTIQGYSLHRSSFSDDGAFLFIDTTLHSIPAGGSGKINVQFRPNHGEGSYVNFLEILSDDASVPSTGLQLKGVGAPRPVYNNVLSITPNPINFGQVEVGSYDSIRVVVRDTGRTPIEINGFFAFGSGTGVQQLGFSGLDYRKTFYPGDSEICMAYYDPLLAKQDSLVFGILGADGVQYVGGIIISGEGVLNLGVVAHSAGGEFSLSPNPSSGRIRMQNLGSSSGGSAEAEIMDLSGIIVFRKSVELTDELFLDVRSLPTGAYFLYIHPKVGEVIVKSIIIESR